MLTAFPSSAAFGHPHVIGALQRREEPDTTNGPT